MPPRQGASTAPSRRVAPPRGTACGSWATVPGAAWCPGGSGASAPHAGVLPPGPDLTASPQEQLRRSQAWATALHAKTCGPTELADPALQPTLYRIDGERFSLQERMRRVEQAADKDVARINALIKVRRQELARLQRETGQVAQKEQCVAATLWPPPPPPLPHSAPRRRAHSVTENELSRIQHMKASLPASAASRDQGRHPLPTQLPGARQRPQRPKERPTAPTAPSSPRPARDGSAALALKRRRLRPADSTVPASTTDTAEGSQDQ